MRISLKGQKMNLSKEQQKYIELVALDRVHCSYANIALYKGSKDYEKSIRQEYSQKGGIKEWIADEIFGANDSEKFQKLDKLETREVKAEIEKIDTIFQNQFSSNKDRKKDFNNDFKAFYKHLFGGFESGEPKCHYCEITQSELKAIFNKGLISSDKFNATLHIERLKPKEPYSTENCVLACALCNNAKSDMIGAAEYKKFFKSTMQSFLTHLKEKL